MTLERLRVTRAAGLWLAVALVLAFVGWYKSINLMLLGGYTLIALAVVNGLVARAMARRVGGQLGDVPPALPGEPVALKIGIWNESRRPAVVRVECATGNEVAAWMLAPLAPKARHDFDFQATFADRGRYLIGPVMVDAAYPAGLVHVTREIAPAVVARVLPRAGRVDPAMLRRWLIRGGAGDAQSRRPSRRATPGSGDVRGLRPYRPGDNPRDVHWRSTARRGQLLVREYDHAEPLDLLLVVDPYLPADASETDRANLEWCLSLAAALGWAWAAADPPADFILVVPAEPTVMHAGHATPGFVRHALAALADIEGMAEVPRIDPSAILTRSSRAARILVSPRESSPLSGTFESAGRPVRTVTPAGLPWYAPPLEPTH